MANIPIYKNPFFIFLICLFLLANLMQSANPELMGKASSMFDYYTSVLLWILTVVACCIGARPKLVYWRRIFWFLSMLGLAVLAIDELMEIHEFQSQRHNINDDYFKVFLWFCAGIALFLVSKLEKCSKPVNATLLWGYLFHTAYIVIEVMGEFIRFCEPWCRYPEEELEFLFLSTYLIAFSMVAFPNWGKEGTAEQTVRDIL